MMKPDDLFIKDFDYPLPEEKIAKYPLPNRDESKLLVYQTGKIEQTIFKNLYQFLPEKSLLIFNNTKVVAVRLLFYKKTGGLIELFCLEPADDYLDIASAMLQRRCVTWKCLVGGAKKWKDELLINKLKTGGQETVLTAKKLFKTEDYFLIEFSWNDDAISFAEVLHLFGNIPLPPYLNRHAEKEDEERYQTIYAQFDGSVAAPTAGLHFTDAVFETLSRKGIETDFVTLHVGAGTFKPVKTETVAEHEMHAEFIEVSIGLIEKFMNAADKKIIAVGTTSLRTMESLYWLGVKIFLHDEMAAEELFLSQWEAYNLPQTITVSQALQALYNRMKKQQLQKLISKTQIIILPGYQLKIADALITNFHQPHSTLLLLIAALVGDDWKKIYKYALDNDFRFLSYGDGSLLWRK